MVLDRIVDLGSEIRSFLLPIETSLSWIQCKERSKDETSFVTARIINKSYTANTVGMLHIPHVLDLCYGSLFFREFVN